MWMPEYFISVLSLAEVPREYRGIDGLVLKFAPDRQDFEEKYRLAAPLDTNLSSYDPMSLRQLHAVSLEGYGSASDPERWLGWDVGYLGVDSGYSLIIQYLRNNRLGSSTDYPLNGSQLFDSVTDAQRLLAEWLAWTPDDPGSKEALLAGDQPDIWAVSYLILPGADRSSQWHVQIP